MLFRSKTACNTAATHYEGLPYDLLGLAAQFTHLLRVWGSGDEIYHVVRPDLIITVRDDGLVVALDGRNVEIVGCNRKVLQLDIEQYGIGVYLDTDQQKCAVVKFSPVACPVMAQRQSDVVGGKMFRINHKVNSELADNLTVLWNQKLTVVNAGNSLLRTHFLGDSTTCKIACLKRCDSDVQVRVAHTDFPHALER